MTRYAIRPIELPDRKLLVVERQTFLRDDQRRFYLATFAPHAVLLREGAAWRCLGADGEALPIPELAAAVPELSRWIDGPCP